jgi:hypothetical protein
MGILPSNRSVIIVYFVEVFFLTIIGVHLYLDG